MMGTRRGTKEEGRGTRDEGTKDEGRGYGLRLPIAIVSLR